MGREKYSKIMCFLSPGIFFPHSKRVNYCLFFDPRSNLTKVKKCQKCHFLTFINIWGCSLWMGDMFPCGRGILPVQEVSCLWKSYSPCGRALCLWERDSACGRALSLWERDSACGRALSLWERDSVWDGSIP